MEGLALSGPTWDETELVPPFREFESGKRPGTQFTVIGTSTGA